MNRQKYRSEATDLTPVIQVGKAGISSVVDEIKKQLKIKKLIKVKFLKSAIFEKSKKELAEELANLTGSELIETRGNTAVFRRKG